MDLDLRPIVPDELAAFKRTDAYGFGFRRNDADEAPDWAELDLDRTVAVFEGDEIVATGRNYSLDLTLPGGAIVPTAAVSWIAVRPTHRRRGILREMMTYLAEEGARRGEPASILTASEGGIYRRFGFGVATRVRSIEIDKRSVTFSDPVVRGRVRMIEPDASCAIAPEVFERVRTQRNGSVSRPAAWWAVAWVEKDELKHRFDAVYEVDGRVEGYVVYGVDGPWGPSGNDRTVTVHDLVATTPDAEAALWQFVCGVDLTQRVVHHAVPEDIELPWRLRNPRHFRTTTSQDWLWLRPLDVAALLGARRYGTADRLVLEVHDGMRPDGDASGRFVLDGGPDGATCSRTDAAADLVLDAAALGSISLGGISPSTMARAGEIDESRPGALGVADRLFATERAPYNFTWF